MWLSLSCQSSVSYIIRAYLSIFLKHGQTHANLPQGRRTRGAGGHPPPDFEKSVNPIIIGGGVGADYTQYKYNTPPSPGISDLHTALPHSLELWTCCCHNNTVEYLHNYLVLCIINKYNEDKFLFNFYQ
jgi:hypothetical protein